MKTIKLKNTEIALYDSIKEMPVTLHNMAQSYYLQESGIGSDMSAFDGHFTAVSSYLSAGRTEDAFNELQNLRFNFYVMLQKADFKSMAFGCYVHSINNEPVIDRSEDGLKNMLEMLSEKGLTMELVEEQLDDLKKNFAPN